MIKRWIKLARRCHTSSNYCLNCCPPVAFYLIIGRCLATVRLLHYGKKSLSRLKALWGIGHRRSVLRLSWWGPPPPPPKKIPPVALARTTILWLGDNFIPDELGWWFLIEEWIFCCCCGEVIKFMRGHIPRLQQEWREGVCPLCSRCYDTFNPLCWYVSPLPLPPTQDQECILLSWLFPPAIGSPHSTHPLPSISLPPPPH